jgi:Na+-translocating ferredoxin:NAD+ oxidoreductase subunit B
MVNVTGEKTGWDAWSQAQADKARKHFHARNARLLREKKENDARLLAKAKEKLLSIAGEIPLTQEQIDENARKKAIIAAAIARASANKP